MRARKIRQSELFDDGSPAACPVLQEEGKRLPLAVLTG